MDAMRNTVSTVIVASRFWARRPNAASWITPSALAATAATPGTCPDATASRSGWSMACVLGIAQVLPLAESAYRDSFGLPTVECQARIEARRQAARRTTMIILSENFRALFYTPFY